MENFTPASALIGGALIGASAVLLMATHGRIAGISGLMSGSLFAERGDRGWRIAFLAGLIAAPLLYALVVAPPEFVMEAGLPLTLAAGALVGFGTRLGAGCTSGHGICGLARLSARSMAAVGVFMLAGMVVATLIRPVLGG